MEKYVIISNNQNREYTDLFPYILKRWNQLGFKVIYLSCYDHRFEGYIPPTAEVFNFSMTPSCVDTFGNMRFEVIVPRSPKILDRYFDIMIPRFFFAAAERFTDDLVVIGDGDLFPINKKMLEKPSCTVDMNKALEEGLVSTAIYPNDDFLATYVFGMGYTWQRLFSGLNTIEQLYQSAEYMVMKTAHMYANDEHYVNWLVKDTLTPIHKCRNRKWIEMGQDMNNLYDFQIDLLQSWQDLCPFVEFHNMRSSTMTEERWEKLFKLLEEYDKHEITPNNYFYESIDGPWKDTIIVRSGYVCVGDEYENIDPVSRVLI